MTDENKDKIIKLTPEQKEKFKAWLEKNNLLKAYQWIMRVLLIGGGLILGYSILRILINLVGMFK